MNDILKSTKTVLLHNVKYEYVNMHLPVWLKSYGDYHTSPKPYSMCSSHEYWQKRSSYSPVQFENRKLELFEKEKQIRHAIIEWYEDCGYMILTPCRWTAEDNVNHVVYHDAPIYYRIGS